jgi:hypothetical protein
VFALLNDKEMMLERQPEYIIALKPSNESEVDRQLELTDEKDMIQSR